MNGLTCDSCKFFEVSDAIVNHTPKLGMCLRYPPRGLVSNVPFMIMGVYSESHIVYYEVMLASTPSCGEYKEREGKKDD